MSIFEALMILSFGAAWPASIYRSYTSRSTKGKSLAFLIIIWIGYLSGILHKVFYTYDIIIILYVLNLIMVSADLALYFRNRKLEERVSSAEA
jgi:hypothetical protein